MASDQSTTVGELRSLVERFVAERQWSVFHDPKNLSMSIAIEAAELMEHFQWVRSEDLAALINDAKLKSEIRDELADVLCYCLALSNVLGLELSDAVRDKMIKNAAKYPAEQYRGVYSKPRGDP